MGKHVSIESHNNYFGVYYVIYVNLQGQLQLGISNKIPNHVILSALRLTYSPNLLVITGGKVTTSVNTYGFQATF